MKLPEAFLTRPLAHRGLHDASRRRVENSLSAIEAAVEHGYGIEIDVQGSADGQAMVFHDDLLDRLTDEQGPVRARPASDLTRLALNGGADCIPTLAEALSCITGPVPLLIEIKDQSGRMEAGDGRLEHSVADTLARYAGPVAVMSFNPASVAMLSRLAPDIPRGLTTCAFDPGDWDLPESVLSRLRQIADYGAVGASFVSHDAGDLHNARVGELARSAAAILCWTVRSPEAEVQARAIAANITFEGYLPAVPG